MIFHLTVIIVLLLHQVGVRRGIESSFVLDFSRQEEIQKEKEQADLREEISKRLDDLIGSTPTRSAGDFKNIAVDRSSLRDDRNTDADQLYKDAARLQAELENGSKAALYEDARNEAVDTRPAGSTDSREQKEYSGPSVVSYNLDGRKASHLKIPAYRCIGEGRVTVIIAVDPQGNVTNAKVQEGTSSTDQCLRQFAVRAARLSKFSASMTAPAKQIGDITYEFIAQ